MKSNKLYLVVAPNRATYQRFLDTFNVHYSNARCIKHADQIRGWRNMDVFVVGDTPPEIANQILVNGLNLIRVNFDGRPTVS